MLAEHSDCARQEQAVKEPSTFVDMDACSLQDLVACFGAIAPMVQEHCIVTAVKGLPGGDADEDEAARFEVRFDDAPHEANIVFDVLHDIKHEDCTEHRVLRQFACEMQTRITMPELGDRFIAVVRVPTRDGVNATAKFVEQAIREVRVPRAAVEDRWRRRMAESARKRGPKERGAALFPRMAGSGVCFDEIHGSAIKSARVLCTEA